MITTLALRPHLTVLRSLRTSLISIVLLNLHISIIWLMLMQLKYFLKCMIACKRIQLKEEAWNRVTIVCVACVSVCLKLKRFYIQNTCGFTAYIQVTCLIIYSITKSNIVRARERMRKYCTKLKVETSN